MKTKNIHKIIILILTLLFIAVGINMTEVDAYGNSYVLVLSRQLTTNVSDNRNIPDGTWVTVSYPGMKERIVKVTRIHYNYRAEVVGREDVTQEFKRNGSYTFRMDHHQGFQLTQGLFAGYDGNIFITQKRVEQTGDFEPNRVYMTFRIRDNVDKSAIKKITKTNLTWTGSVINREDLTSKLKSDPYNFQVKNDFRFDVDFWKYYKLTIPNKITTNITNLNKIREDTSVTFNIDPNYLQNEVKELKRTEYRPNGNVLQIKNIKGDFNNGKFTQKLRGDTKLEILEYNKYSLQVPTGLKSNQKDNNKIRENAKVTITKNGITNAEIQKVTITDGKNNTKDITQEIKKDAGYTFTMTSNHKINMTSNSKLEYPDDLIWITKTGVTEKYKTENKIKTGTYIPSTQQITVYPYKTATGYKKYKKVIIAGRDYTKEFNDETSEIFKNGVTLKNKSEWTFDVTEQDKYTITYNSKLIYAPYKEANMSKSELEKATLTINRKDTNKKLSSKTIVYKGTVIKITPNTTYKGKYINTKINTTDITTDLNKGMTKEYTINSNTNITSNVDMREDYTVVIPKEVKVINKKTNKEITGTVTLKDGDKIDVIPRPEYEKRYEKILIPEQNKDITTELNKTKKVTVEIKGKTTITVNLKQLGKVIIEQPKNPADKIELITKLNNNEVGMNTKIRLKITVGSNNYYSTLNQRYSNGSSLQTQLARAKYNGSSQNVTKTSEVEITTSPKYFEELRISMNLVNKETHTINMINDTNFTSHILRKNPATQNVEKTLLAYNTDTTSYKNAQLELKYDNKKIKREYLSSVKFNDREIKLDNLITKLTVSAETNKIHDPQRQERVQIKTNPKITIPIDKNDIKETNEIYWVDKGSTKTITIPEGTILVVNGKDEPQNSTNTYNITFTGDTTLDLRDTVGVKVTPVPDDKVFVNGTPEDLTGNLLGHDVETDYYKKENYVVQVPTGKVWNIKGVNKDGKFYFTTGQKDGVELDSTVKSIEFLTEVK